MLAAMAQSDNVLDKAHSYLISREQIEEGLSQKEKKNLGF